MKVNEYGYDVARGDMLPLRDDWWLLFDRHFGNAVACVATKEMADRYSGCHPPIHVVRAKQEQSHE